MKSFFLTLFTAISLMGCATKPRIQPPPAFVAPSAAPAKATVMQARAKVVKATERAQAVVSDLDSAQAAVARLESQVTGAPGVPAAGDTKPIFEEVKLRLDAAAFGSADLLLQLQQALGDLDLSYTRVQALEAEAVAQTDLLNEVSARASRLSVENVQLTQDRDRWRKLTLEWRLWASIAVVALLAYLFRGPMLFGARKLVGLP
jgi:hypothetical protein